MYRQIIYFFIPCIILVLTVGCDKDDDSEVIMGCMDSTALNFNPDATEACGDCCEYTFSRVGLLTNWADNIIIPKYSEFQNSLSSLSASIENFVSNPDITSLEDVSNSWLQAYKIWQHLQMFNIGYADDINGYSYYEKINIYPIDVDAINTAINNQYYDINNSDDVIQGFPCIDYMLHHNTPNNIVQLYINNSLYGSFLTALIDNMISITDLVAEDWNTYREDFINSTDNTITSSINLLINDYIYYFEKFFRDGKIAIPAGIRSGGIPQPNDVEAYYKADVSKELALEALYACENFFSGKYLNTDVSDVTLLAYLNYLPSSPAGLAEDISNKFTEIETGISSLNDNFILQIEDTHIPMVQVFATMQQQVALLKTDMLGALQISIDYVDTDGD